MGYNSQFEYEIESSPLIVNPEIVKDIEEYFSSDSQNADVYGFSDVEIIYNEKTNELEEIILEEYTSKFYDQELFVKMFHKCIVSGTIKFIFKGEDCDIWGYKLYYDKIEELTPLLLTTEEYELIYNFRQRRLLMPKQNL